MKYTSEEIISGLLEKDAKVFKFLYQKFGHLIMGYVRKNSGSEEEAREMVQVVILDLWIAVKEGRYQEQGKLERYIYQLTANSWREELRRKRNQPKSSLDDGVLQIADESSSDLASAIVKDKYLQAIHSGIEQMGEPCRTIIQLYHLKKVSLQEVAEKMQYDYDNLRKRIFDCRKKLKKIVEKIVQLDVEI